MFAVPEKIHTYPMEGHRKFLGGGGVLKVISLKARCEVKLEFSGGGQMVGVGTKQKTSVGGVWIFSGTPHAHFKVIFWGICDSPLSNDF